MSEDKNRFRELLREYRLKANMGLREFCQRYNLNMTVYSAFERGVLIPDIRDCNRLIGIHIGLVDAAECRASMVRKFFDSRAIARVYISRVTAEHVKPSMMFHGATDSTQYQGLADFLNDDWWQVINEYYEHGMYARSEETEDERE